MKKCFIRVGDIVFSVTEEGYKDYYQALERWKYIKKKERRKKLSYDKALNDGLPIGILSCTEMVSVEDEAEKNIMIERMLNAVGLLENDERHLIQQLFFYEVSMRELARNNGVTEAAIRKRKRYILKKIRFYMEI